MESLKKPSYKLFVLFIALCIAFLTLRLVEFFYIEINHHIIGKSKWFIYALTSDIKLSAIVVVLLVPLNFLNYRFILFIQLFLLVLFVLINGLLTFYFLELLEPLDKSLFKHTLLEIFYILLVFGTFSWWHFLIALPLVVFLVIYQLFNKRNLKIGYLFSVFSIFCVIAFLIQPKFNLERNDFDANETFYLSSNKFSYFIFNSFIKTQSISNLSIEQAVSVLQTTQNKNFISKTFPLLHIDTTKSSLKPFFALEKEPPSIVFIIVESLSSTYSGISSKELSFTPFLDSLANKSLTFNNFLSTGERTFAVLPSLFASAPHGENGFINMKERMPNHFSIIQLLTENGYDNSAFFYGGYAHYSYYDVFMNSQNVKTIYEQSKYNYEGTELVLSKDDIPFGIDDDELFKKAMVALDTIGNKTPYIHSYLTLTMHAPFRFKNQEHYIQKVKSRIHNNIDNKRYRKSLNALSTILYTDDVLRHFFESYKKRPEYQNTIFIITGDHRIAKPKALQNLDTYHVPLYIFSPLLKRTKSIRSVNTHLDVAPSLSKMFSETYGFNLHKSNSWLGYDFDTSDVFESNRSVEFMLNNTYVEQYLHGAIFYDYGKLFHIGDGFSLTPLIEDKRNEIFDSIKRIISANRIVSKYIVNNNKVFPLAVPFDTLYCKSQQDIHIIKPEDEFYPLLNFKLTKDYHQLNLSIEIPLIEDIIDSVNFPILVLTVNHADDSKPFWVGHKFSDYLVSYDEELVVKLEQQLNAVADVKLKKGDMVKVYLWKNKPFANSFLFSLSQLCLTGKKK